VLKNALARLPECAHLGEAEITVSEKDERCTCSALTGVGLFDTAYQAV
jgi:hypothetical protein